MLLSVEEFHPFGERGPSLLERLSMDDDLDIEIEPVDIELEVPEL